MAESRVLQILIEAKDNASKELSGLNKQLKTLEPTFKKMALIGTATFTAISLGAKNAIDSASEFQGISTDFSRMTDQIGIDGDKLIDKLNEVSMGTVSNTDLMLSTNKAMALGVGNNIDDITKLMEIARLKGRALGLDTTQAFNDIVTGIGRGSPLILDNLGIIIKQEAAQEAYAKQLGKTVDEMTDAEKSQSIFNAVMESGTKDLELAGELSLSFGEKMQQISKETADASVSLGESLLPVIETLADIIIPLIKNISKFAKENQTLVKILTLTALGISGVVAVLGTVGLILPSVLSGFKVFKSLLNSVKLSAISLSSVGIMAIITALALVATKLFEARRELQSWGEVWEYTGLGIRRTFLTLGASIVETWGNVLNALNLGGDSFITKANDMRREAGYMAIEQVEMKDRAKEASEALAEEGNIAKTAGNSLSDLGTDLEDLAEKTEEAEDKIRALYESTVEVGQNYKKEIKSNEASYIEDIINTVADAEEEKAKLQSELSTLMAEAPVEEVRSRQEELRGLMKEQDEIINTYKDSEMNLDEEVVERRRYLNMNELDQMEYDYKKKQELAKTNYLIETATNLLKIQNYKETIDNMLSVDVSYYTEVIENEKTVTEVKREELETQTQDLKTYLDKQKSLYSSHYSGIGISSPFLNNSDDYVGNKSYYTPKNINNDVESSEKKTVINIDMRGATITDETITDKISNNLLKNLSYSK